MQGQFTYSYQDKELLVKWEGYSIPARLHGAPEDCFPAESEMSVMCDDLSPEEMSRLENDLIEKAWEEYDQLEDANGQEDFDDDTDIE